MWMGVTFKREPKRGLLTAIMLKVWNKGILMSTSDFGKNNHYQFLPIFPNFYQFRQTLNFLMIFDTATELIGLIDCDWMLCHLCHYISISTEFGIARFKVYHSFKSKIISDLNSAFKRLNSSFDQQLYLFPCLHSILLFSSIMGRPTIASEGSFCRP